MIKCIYHKIDADGVASAALVKMYADRIGEKVEFYPFDYGDELDITEFGTETVFVVDCTLEPASMSRLYDYSNLIWIDHHASAIKDSITYGYDTAFGIRCDTFSACELTYRHILKSGVRLKIKYQHLLYIGLYDSFSGMKCPEIKDEVLAHNLGIYTYGILSIPNMIDYLTGTLAKFEDVIYDGKVIYSHILNNATQTYNQAKRMIYSYAGKDYKVLLHSGDRMNLLLYLDKEITDQFDMFISYNNAIGGRGSITLYSEKVDVSIIAKRHNGGGHKGASGIPELFAKVFLSNYLYDDVPQSESNTTSNDDSKPVDDLEFTF